MEQRVKFRLVGAVIVLLLGLFVLPPLLRIPLPQLDLSQHIPPPPPSPADVDQPLKRHEWTIESLLADQAPPDVTALHAAVNMPFSEKGKGVTTKGGAAATDNQHAQLLPESTEDAPVQSKAPVAISYDASGAPEAWLLQIAAFEQYDNAKRLEVKLLAKGYAAQLRSDHNRHMTRVYIGPSLDKAALRRQAQEIEQSFELKVQLVRYKARD